MSDKTYSLLLIGAGIIIILVGFLLGWNIKPEKVCPSIQDTLYVKGDSIPVPYPVEIIRWKEKQPGIPNIDSSIHSAVFDSQFVSHRDTIGFNATVSHNESTKEFLWDAKIEHRDVEILRVDTIKVNYVEVQEVEVPDPVWVTIAVSEAIVILSIIAAFIFGG